ncbi:transcriptional regulator [Glutamicibacter endophyticus]|uniref:transcriptional regulator n=1 Tax=Glutamicibacter endophyticus TaxID=1522174 RepID=UPI003AF087D4
MSDFGLPPKGQQIRGVIQARLTQAMSEQGAKVTIDWRGDMRHLYVISMPLSLLFFNPDTHRIRAQRMLDPERNNAIEDDPWGEEAQSYLRDLLRQRPANPDQIDPDYIALRDELDSAGQREPGIVSPYGVLVDGNTRAAALYDIGEQNIRVGVLPDDTSRQDINNVELSLQLRKDRRRDYSYINRLIAIDEELGRGRSESDVAKDFNIKLATLQRDRWVYGQILDAIDRSATGQGTALRLIDFEQHQEKLRELHRDYASLMATDPDAAKRVLQSRLAMLLLDYPKTSLRLAEHDFHSRYLADRLPDSLKTSPTEGSGQSVPGIPGTSLPRVGEDVEATEALTSLLLRSKAISIGANGESSNEIQAATAIMRTARETFDKAVKLAGQNAELVKRQTAVPERLTDAADYVVQCANEFAEARAKRALDDEAFDDALIVLRDSLRGLARHASRAYGAPSEGVEWLLEAARLQ